MDLAIGEFEEVGMAIKEFASDEAVVVVGTVIDPEMNDELRVTVVATGIGGQVTMQAEEPPQVKLVERNNNGEVDYEDLDRPTVIRKRVAGEHYQEQGDQDLDYLDVPAFLRRQAD